MKAEIAEVAHKSWGYIVAADLGRQIAELEAKLAAR
jgi:hypothetical protein